MTVRNRDKTAIRKTGTIAVSGSKGGVGKSNLVANLAVALARWGREVLLVDGDLGLSNLDVLLGLVPKHNVDHVMHGEAEMEDVLMEGPHGVRVLPAASGLPELASIDGLLRERLLGLLAEASETVDDLLVDTGAGLGETSLALQLAASRVILVTTPEPTSLVDAYASLKVLWSADPDKPVDLVVNDVIDDADANRAFEQVSKAARHFLGREPGWFGPVYRDGLLQEAVRSQRCLIDLYPDARASRCYERIALRLTLDRDVPVPPADYWTRLLEGNEEVAH